MSLQGGVATAGLRCLTTLPVWALQVGVKLFLSVLLVASGSVGLPDETLPAERPKAVQSEIGRAHV